MIYAITGCVRGRETQMVFVEVHGICLGVYTPHPEQYADNACITLHTVLQWNQETGPQLFGFDTIYDRAFFFLVIGCSGIGPKLALALLTHATATACVAAITCADNERLSVIKGIGPKKAESLIMQLRDKVAQLPTPPESEASYTMQQLTDVAEALRALRYSSAEIATSLEHVRQHELLRNATFDQIMRAALSKLAR